MHGACTTDQALPPHTPLTCAKASASPSLRLTPCPANPTVLPTLHTPCPANQALLTAPPHLCKSFSIPQPQVHALSRQGVYRMGRISYQGQARQYVPAGQGRR